MHTTVMSGLVVLVFAALALSACSKEDDKPSEKEIRERNAVALVKLAKLDIAAGEYSAATAKCLKAEELAATYDEAKYCVLVAQVGALVKSAGSIIGLIASTLNTAPAYGTQLQIKPLIATLLNDIEAEMLYIDRYAYKLTEMDNPHFQILDFPLSIDPKDVLDLVNSDRLVVNGDIALNLKGTWDKSEAQALGAGINAAQALIDYVLAHQLLLATTKISFDTTGAVAKFLADNHDLFVADPKDAARIKGDGGDKHKGLKNGVMAALSFLVGREATLALVAPKNPGLKEAIKASAAEAGLYPDQIVRWIDANKDGIPEKLGMPAVNAIKDKVLADGKPIIEGDTFDNPLKPETWEIFIKVGKQVLANVEKGGGSPIPAKEALVSLVDSLKKSTSTTRLLLKPVPDVAALEPGGFFKAPKYINELMPYYYFYSLAATSGSRFADLAIETEVYQGSSNYLNRHGQRHGANQTADFTHFEYPGSDVFSGVYTVTAYMWDDFATKPQAMAADTVTATAKTPRLWYFAVQDASFGGMLFGDAEFKKDGTGGNYVALDNAKLWKSLNKLLKYYCIDTTDFALEMFDDTYEKYTNNKIADCDQDL